MPTRDELIAALAKADPDPPIDPRQWEFFYGASADAVLALFTAELGVAPDKPALNECNDERCVLPSAHDLGEFGCLVDPGVAPDQPNGDKR